MTAGSIPLWLDCDPGTDDAFAILLAVFHPRFKLLGISTVHGNAPLKSTTHNTLALLEVLKVKNIPVYKGESKPLVKDPYFAFYAHGKSGMGGANLPENISSKPANDKTYMEAIRDAILEYPDEICIAATGTFTNMSKLFEKYPELRGKVKYLTIMGAGFGIGNVTPYAEFNCYVDPEAANNLFHDEVLRNKIIVNGLNITHTVIADQKRKEQLFGKPAKNNVRPMFESIMEFYYRQLYAEKGWEGPPLHDPVALFTLLPFLFPKEDFGLKWFRRKVTAIERGEHDGETIFDNGTEFEDDSNEEDGCIIARSVSCDKFFEYLGEALDNAEEYVEEN